ncbi:8-oxo-dGTP diphosphatase [Paenibacillus ginsengarvi]|uniref:8-oxo-dGTP diphosphatase n=1 Tax=Paenibacillus ginsengarvi TaxID=400777 RepID=A0A3B0CIC2_9BACL|nr:8-oxo-dGTP diphosphatase [Paenibacillus ginsengarvi]
MSKVEMTNMCMIHDRSTGKVLMQDRIKSWKGLSFPGGHVEDGESIIDSTIREIKEETGLTIADLELCGIVNWYNDVTGDKYLVFSYRTETFSGQLLEQTEEGRLLWVDKSELPSLPLAEGLKGRLPMFLDKAYSEGFGVWNEHRKSEMKWQ